MRRGFTLTEILIALGIVIVFITLPALTYGSYLKKVRDLRRKSDVNSIQQALEQYRANNGLYPTEETWKDVLVEGGYIATIPNDPKEGEPVPNETGLTYEYVYISNPQENTYQLRAFLEGTTDQSGTGYYVVSPVGPIELIVSPGSGPPPTTTPITGAPSSPMAPLAPMAPQSAETPLQVFPLVITKLVDGYPKVFTMNDDGSDLTPLTDGLYEDRPAHWRNSRDRIVFSSSRESDQWYEMDIYSMNLQGSSVTRLTTTLNNAAPALADDGTIVFTTSRDGNSEIYRMALNGTLQTRLTDNLKNDLAPDISPNGMYTTFTRVGNGERALYIMNTDGSNVMKLVDTDTSWLTGIPAEFNASGTHVYFFYQHPSDSSQNGFYRITTDGSTLTRLFSTTEIVNDLSLSPDSSHFVYYDQDHNLIRINTNGTERTIIETDVFSADY